MIMITKRYFDNKKVEEMTWCLCGTKGIDMDDPRKTPIGMTVIHPETGENIDCWVCIAMSNPAFNVSYQDTITGTDIIYDDTQNKMIQTNIVQRTVVPFNYMTEPLLPGYTQITEPAYLGLFG